MIIPQRVNRRINVLMTVIQITVRIKTRRHSVHKRKRNPRKVSKVKKMSNFFFYESKNKRTRKERECITRDSKNLHTKLQKFTTRRDKRETRGRP